MGGGKTIEIRINDEKRRALHIGDTLTFANRATAETHTVLITNLISAPSFLELFRKISLPAAGWPLDTSPESAALSMRNRYPEAEERQHGVVAIEIK